MLSGGLFSSTGFLDSHSTEHLQNFLGNYSAQLTVIACSKDFNWDKRSYK